MKSIIVPKKNTPPFSESIVLEITPKEAADMLKVYESFVHNHGYKPLAYLNIVNALTDFIKRTESKRGTNV